MVGLATCQLSGTVPGFDGAGKPTPSSPLTTNGSTTFDPFVNSSGDRPTSLSLVAHAPRTRQGRAVRRRLPARPPTRSARWIRPASLTPNAHGVPQVFQWANRMGLGTLNVCYKTTARSTTVEGCSFATSGWWSTGLLTGCAQTVWDRLPAPT